MISLKPKSASASTIESRTLEFFRTRAATVARLDELAADIRDKTRAVESLLEKSAGQSIPNLPQQLAELEGLKRSLVTIRAGVVDQLARHDKGFAAAAESLRSSVTIAREACLNEVRGLMRDKVAWAFESATGQDTSPQIEKDHRIDCLVDETAQVQAEDRRHFALRSFADAGTIAAYLPLAVVYLDELAIVQARIAAVKLARAGKKQLGDLPEHSQCHAGTQTKKVNDAYDPPESADAFAARRAARLRQWEAVRSQARKDGLTKLEVEEVGLHPDRDPTFKRFLGTKAA